MKKIGNGIIKRFYNGKDPVDKFICHLVLNKENK